jgi:aspartate carbamoyltransferase catalytic subunit
MPPRPWASRACPSRPCVRTEAPVDGAVGIPTARPGHGNSCGRLDETVGIGALPGLRKAEAPPYSAALMTAHASVSPLRFPHRHLLGIEGLSAGEITLLLDLAEGYVTQNRQADKKSAILRGRTVINLFFENSTRTRTSFELAGKRLGGDVINMQASTSSIKKGETLIDTAMTLNAMHPDVLVVRHSDSGAVKLLSDKVNCSVINAGDGSHEHPTQALLDALTIRRRKGRIRGLTVAICGDILHSRVARSNICLLNAMGARVRVVAPPTLLPSAVEALGVEVFYDMKSGLKDVDVIMMLRLQTERMHGSFVPSIREYFHFFGLDYAKLALAKEDAMIMHPGPMNRGVEIDSEVADDIGRSAIHEQVEMGVAVRMACLDVLMRHDMPSNLGPPDEDNGAGA